MFKSSTLWQIRERLPRTWIGVFVSLSFGIPLLLWTVISASGWVQPANLLPTPLAVWQKTIELWNEGLLLGDIKASLWRIVVGYSLGVIVAIPLGILMGSFATVRWLCEPLIGILRYMPATAFTPLLVVYLGLDEAPKMSLIFIGTFFFNTLMIMDGVKFIPKDWIDISYTLGANHQQVLTEIIWPAMIPVMLDAIRINLASAWNLVIVAELIAANEGLGKRIALAQRFLGVDQMFSCLIVIGILGVACDLSLKALMNWQCHWVEGRS